MGTKWNRLAKKPQEDLNKQLKQELSTEKKSPDELIKLLTEYINMSEAAEHPDSQKHYMVSGMKKKDIHYRR